jgi:hypothetical protein
MASIDDVYNQLLQVNSNLVQVHTDLGQVNSNLTTGFGNVVTATNQVNTTLTTGFTAVESGLSQLITLGQYEDLALSHISKQDDTIICLLDKIARTLCAMLNESVAQTLLQTGILAADNNLTDMYASGHAEAALDLERRAALQAEIQQCCPPPTPPLPCKFEPCPAPDPLRDPPGGGQGG